LEREQGGNTPRASTRSSAKNRKKYTVERKLQYIQPNIPSIICRDFNAYHQWWNPAIRKAKNVEVLVKWLRKTTCQLLNIDASTFWRSNLREKSIIDLTFHTDNFQENTCGKWAILEKTGSDHEVIGFSVFTRQTESYINPLLELPFNLKKADWQKFKKLLKEELSSLEDTIELGENLFINNFWDSPSNIGNFL